MSQSGCSVALSFSYTAVIGDLILQQRRESLRQANSALRSDFVHRETGYDVLYRPRLSGALQQERIALYYIHTCRRHRLLDFDATRQTHGPTTRESLLSSRRGRSLAPGSLSQPFRVKCRIRAVGGLAVSPSEGMLGGTCRRYLLYANTPSNAPPLVYIYVCRLRRLLMRQVSADRSLIAAAYEYIER
jgi:hypothetical protein